MRTLMTQGRRLIISDRLNLIMNRRRRTRSMKEDTRVSKLVINCAEYVKAHEVSDQIDFARSGQFNEKRKDPNVVELYPEWKKKEVSPLRFMDSYADIFVPMDGI